MVGGLEDVLYWDPVPHIDGVLRLLPARASELTVASVFGGKWEERNWRNVPGPLHGAGTDNCWVGRSSAPRHILYGDDTGYEREFLYRQPGTVDELADVLDGMWQDPLAGWACDGDSWWTPGLLREWWRQRPRLRNWITSKHRAWVASANAGEREAAAGLPDYLEYLDGDLPVYLRWYLYFLDHGRGPSPKDRLPTL